MLILLCLQAGIVPACDRLKINQYSGVDRLRESDIVSLVMSVEAL